MHCGNSVGDFDHRCQGVAHGAVVSLHGKLLRLDLNVKRDAHNPGRENDGEVDKDHVQVDQVVVKLRYDLEHVRRRGREAEARDEGRLRSACRGTQFRRQMWDTTHVQCHLRAHVAHAINVELKPAQLPVELARAHGGLQRRSVRGQHAVEPSSLLVTPSSTVRRGPYEWPAPLGRATAQDDQVGEARPRVVCWPRRVGRPSRHLTRLRVALVHQATSPG